MTPANAQAQIIIVLVKLINQHNELTEAMAKMNRHVSDLEFILDCLPTVVSYQPSRAPILFIQWIMICSLLPCMRWVIKVAEKKLKLYQSDINSLRRMLNQ
jgi:hypothetical protein